MKFFVDTRQNKVELRQGIGPRRRVRVNPFSPDPLMNGQSTQRMRCLQRNSSKVALFLEVYVGPLGRNEA